jgi:hypothetical protein
LAIATGIVTLTICDFFQKLSQKIRKNNRLFQNTLLLIPSLLIIALALYPIFWKHFPYGNYIVGKNPELYRFLAQQPKNINIASLTEETDNLGSFSQRSILFSWEHAIPYQKGYYMEIKNRARKLIDAQYSRSTEKIHDFINQYKVSHILLDKNAFLPEYRDQNKWLEQDKDDSNPVLHTSENIQDSALAKTTPTCSIFSNKNMILLSSDCVIKIKK